MSKVTHYVFNLKVLGHVFDDIPIKETPEQEAKLVALELLRDRINSINFDELMSELELIETEEEEMDD
jgi:hypothetical protein